MKRFIGLGKGDRKRDDDPNRGSQPGGPPQGYTPGAPGSGPSEQARLLERSRSLLWGSNSEEIEDVRVMRTQQQRLENSRFRNPDPRSPPLDVLNIFRSRYNRDVQEHARRVQTQSDEMRQRLGLHSAESYQILTLPDMRSSSSYSPPSHGQYSPPYSPPLQGPSHRHQGSQGSMYAAPGYNQSQALLRSRVLRNIVLFKTDV
ncbi:hypothetical protein EXIGLDRAFT_705731 [Exidia glandulosa HHB12029]|uniref:Uncharacterized protein n=1 Tax=Exidia glandulosa HHB12029 TaxID=1314781 RepID=A0A165KHE0_EXIGL|nr:hypothetical protein EXIGLDRAFT_705731 [Exidia glandulosa HHB12029]